METDDKPFECPHPGCPMRFANEDHLSVHKMKHEMSLSLTEGLKSTSSGLFVDQTPTPTKFLKMGEEIGLFNDLGKNPFEESFKKAVDTGHGCAHIANTPETQSAPSLGTLGTIDSLNTPTPHPFERPAQPEYIPLPGPTDETSSTLNTPEPVSKKARLLRPAESTVTTTFTKPYRGTPLMSSPTIDSSEPPVIMRHPKFRKALELGSPSEQREFAKASPATTPTSSSIGLGNVVGEFSQAPAYKPTIRRSFDLPIPSSRSLDLPVASSRPLDLPIAPSTRSLDLPIPSSQTNTVMQGSSEADANFSHAVYAREVAATTVTRANAGKEGMVPSPLAIVTSLSENLSPGNVTSMTSPGGTSPRTAEKPSQYTIQVLLQLPNGMTVPVQIPAAIATNTDTTAETIVSQASAGQISTTTVSSSNIVVTSSIVGSSNKSTVATATSTQGSTSAPPGSLTKQKLKAALQQNIAQNILNSNMRVMTEAVDRVTASQPAAKAVTMPVSMAATPALSPVNQGSSTSTIGATLAVRPQAQSLLMKPMSPVVQMQAADTSTPFSKRPRRSTEDDPDERRRKFLERNRAAAARCRQKRKVWITSLEKKADELQATNSRLQGEVNSLRNEVVSLKAMLLAHKDCPITMQQRTSGQFKFATTSLSSTSSVEANDVKGKDSNYSYHSLVSPEQTSEVEVQDDDLDSRPSFSDDGDYDDDDDMYGDEDNT